MPSQGHSHVVGENVNANSGGRARLLPRRGRQKPRQHRPHCHTKFTDPWWIRGDDAKADRRVGTCRMWRRTIADRGDDGYSDYSNEVKHTLWTGSALVYGG